MRREKQYLNEVFLEFNNKHQQIKTHYSFAKQPKLLQVYDKEHSNLFYILYIITAGSSKQRYRVQITGNKVEDYILRYHKLDSLFYFKFKGSKKRFRQNLSYIFSHKLKAPLNQAQAKITSMLTDTSVLPYQKLILSQIYIYRNVNCTAFWICGLCQLRVNDISTFSSRIKLFIMLEI
ncbi:unnamed protein product [Paramecium octaurelia]|uniref:Uncharacterized protein n=1 Tax=Paramecium octaurelia TaxID=43137 RepID=A0A8S1VNS5_PAROT|nr:unnamed protein product [Paramecium octaurelia]